MQFLFWWVTVVPTASTLSGHSPLLRPLAAVVLYYSNIRTHGTAIVCLDLLPTTFWTGFCLSVVHSFLFFSGPSGRRWEGTESKGDTFSAKGLKWSHAPLGGSSWLLISEITWMTVNGKRQIIFDSVWIFPWLTYMMFVNSEDHFSIGASRSLSQTYLKISKNTSL